MAGGWHVKNSPKFEGRGALYVWVGIGGVIGLLQVVYAKPLDIFFYSAAVLNLIFDYPFLRKGYSTGSTMVLLPWQWSVPTGCQYKPLLYLAPFGLGVVSSHFRGNGGRKWVVTSSRLSIVAIGLSLTVFVLLRLVTDGRRNWSCKKRHCPLQTAA